MAKLTKRQQMVAEKVDREKTYSFLSCKNEVLVWYVYFKK